VEPVKSGPAALLDAAAIRTILTLRYNATIKDTLLPKLAWHDFKENRELAKGDPVSQVEKLLVENLTSEITRSKKVAFSLSGGVDSTLIFALLRKNLPDVDVHAISVRFADSADETPRAAKIAEQFGAEHHVIFVENYLQELPSAISITKQPFWDLHWHLVVKKAKSISDMLLSGDGGDELFGGYTFRYSKFLSLTRDDPSVESSIKAYLSCHERDWVPDQEKVFGEKCRFSWDEIHDILRPYFDNELDPVAKVYLADFNGKLLYNWLPLYAALHNHFGVRLVSPLLSRDMVRYATHLPYSLKYDPASNEGKILLRRLLAKHLDLKAAGFGSAAKQGFSVDTLNLWKKYGRRICDYYLSDARTVKDGWINGAWIKQHIGKVEGYNSHRYVNKFLGLLAFEVWYRLFITHELRSDDQIN
jgi:asparagine synthase (glutamine-hydrolysing)